MAIINPVYKDLENQTISKVLNFIPEDSRLDYIKNYSNKEDIKEYNELMCETLDKIINVYNKSLCVSLLCYVNDYNVYTDAGKLDIHERTKVLGDLVQAHPVLSGLFRLSQKYRLFDIIFDCTYFTPCKKMSDANFKLSSDEIYKTEIDVNRPDIDMYINNKSKLIDPKFVDETMLDYGHGTYPSVKHTGFIFHTNFHLTNFRYLGKAITMPKFGAEVASYLLWFVQYQEYMKAQFNKDIEYYNNYKKMYSEAASTLKFYDTTGELQYMMFNFPKTIEWWEENYRKKYNDREKQRKQEEIRRINEEKRRKRLEADQADQDSKWLAHRLENNLDYNSNLDNVAKKMTGGYILTPDEYVGEIEELLNMNVKSLKIGNNINYFCDDCEHINWKSTEKLRTIHRYAITPFNRAATCKEVGLFDVSEDDVEENDDINKKELAQYYNNDIEEIAERVIAANPKMLDYDYNSMYYTKENTISEKDISEFDAIIAEINDFTKKGYGVTLLKDIDSNDVPNNAIYVETIPYKVSDIYLDGLIPKRKSEEKPIIEQSASGILYGKEVSNEDKYLLNTSIYKELLRIANTFAINLDSIADIYYNTETNKMYIKLPKSFVSKHIYTLYNKKFNVISRSQYIENTIAKCTTATTTNKYTVYRCNVYNPYKPRDSIQKLLDEHDCDRDDGYG